MATAGYAESYWLIEYGYWNAQCDGSLIYKDGIVFSSFRSLEELCRIFRQGEWMDGWMDAYRMSSIAPSYRHQGRCLVEEGGNVTGWPLLACVALSGLALPLPRTYIDPLRAP